MARVLDQEWLEDISALGLRDIPRMDGQKKLYCFHLTRDKHESLPSYGGGARRVNISRFLKPLGSMDTTFTQRGVRSRISHCMRLWTGVSTSEFYTNVGRNFSLSIATAAITQSPTLDEAASVQKPAELQARVSVNPAARDTRPSNYASTSTECATSHSVSVVSDSRPPAIQSSSGYSFLPGYPDIREISRRRCIQRHMGRDW
jgi:hypothetical protein